MLHRPDWAVDNNVIAVNSQQSVAVRICENHAGEQLYWPVLGQPWGAQLGGVHCRGLSWAGSTSGSTAGRGPLQGAQLGGVHCRGLSWAGSTAGGLAGRGLLQGA